MSEHTREPWRRPRHETTALTPEDKARIFEELLEAAREVWKSRQEIFEDPVNVGPESGLGAALLALELAIAKAGGERE